MSANPAKKARMSSDNEKNTNRDREKEKKAAKAEYDRKRRARLSDELKKADAERKQNARSNETEAEAVLRKNKNTEHMRQVRTQQKNIQIKKMASLKAQAEGCMENENTITEDFCGNMSEICFACKAKHFEGEPYEYFKIDNNSIRCKRYSQCCQKGQVDLTTLYNNQEHRTYPDILKSLLKKESEIGKNLMENIRSVNSSFAYASTGANISPPPGYGTYCFRICGQIYHRTGTLHPAEGESRQYAQLYILDTGEANQERMKHSANKNVDPAVFNIIADFMEANNELAKKYRMLHEVEKESKRDAIANGNPETEVTMAIISDGNYDKRRYNAATVDEVAIVFQNKDGEPPLERDLLIHLRPKPGDPNKGVKRIDILNMYLDAMAYPLLFPYGQRSWGVDLFKTTKQGKKRLTLMDYYSYIFSIRDDFNPFLNAGKLTQQYFVDAYVKMEANRLSYIENNQSEWRGDTLKGFQDYVASEAEAQGKKPGKVVILPSSFQGSPRHMQQNYQDAMAIVTQHGKPDLFVTITCNPKWREIQENLAPWQSAEHRPDLVARVFKMKLDRILKDITRKEGGIFGTAIAFVYVIEFQKRGLPHAHLLLILDKNSKLDTPEKIDKVVRAEIPDQTTHPRLYEIVTNNMVHGPCGKGIKAPCMNGDNCTKHFPKDFQEKTLGGESISDGFAKYKRRPGTEVIVKGRTIDNRWIVPYNPYLLLKYNCHINVEVCASIKCVKYLFKYVYKGHDCANVEIKETNTFSHDEVKKHVDSRYVSSPESSWRIFGNSMHGHSHSIERLAVHLPGEEYIVIKTGATSGTSSEGVVEKQIEHAQKKHTTLTAWFELNKVNENARDLYYWQIPLHFTWLKSEGKWKNREKGFNKIARMYSVSPKDAERFYMRLILLNVKGAQSFKDLMTYEGITYDTYRESAKARGLLEDDSVWQRTIDDAILCKMPKQLRQVFAYICAFCNPTDPKKLWADNIIDLTEDFCYKLHQSNGECRNCELYALKDLKQYLILLGATLDQFGLPEPPINLPDIDSDSINVEFEQNEANRMINTLNLEQKNAFDSVILAINDQTLGSKCFFLDGPGGSGKTYLYKTLLHYLKGRKLIVLPTASTGIAANLLSGGRTFHSLFKLGIPITEKTVAGIKSNSQLADLIRNAILIIIDECTMASSHAMDAIDRCLRELMECLGGKDVPFGGKVILMGGDFRQCLAIIPHAKRSAIVQGSLKYSASWGSFKRLALHNNVRSVDLEYSEWLLRLGDGNLSNEYGLGDDVIEIPNHMVCNDSIIQKVYGDRISIDNVKHMSKRAILCPKNSSVDKINDEILGLIEGDEYTYKSIDKIDCNDGTDFPTEFVNSLTPSGMPPHNLKLKLGAVIMLLRNLNTKEGLCNGTRLFVTGLQTNLIKAEVLTGSAEGNEVLIPRIDLSPTNTGLPFKLTRRQFPVRVAFAMTINKSQGQTLDKVGIYLPEPVFGHGQLYVAFSRVRRSEDVIVKIDDTQEQGKLLEDSDAIFTRNVVYHEIF